MLTALAVAALAIIGSEQAEPLYILEYPGIAFDWLPEVLNPPVEGTLTEEAGVVVSGPNSSGIEYRLYYWKEDLETNTRKDEWLNSRFRNIISPDILPSLVIGNIEWIEGSIASPHREGSSLGLIPSLNFNMIGSSGEMLGKGKACAIFTEDYSILLYSLTPGGGSTDIASDFDGMISLMYLTGD